MPSQLQDILDTQVALNPVPGVAVSMVLDGEVTHAVHGVTSVEHPLDVDRDTIFQFGSTGKTYTATAIMILAEAGKVDLDATVQTYLPDFRVADEEASRAVLVRHLLNHSAGWAGDFLGTPERGDRALEDFVEHMVDLKQDFEPGSQMSYNNAALSVAGRIIEVVTGMSFNDAMAQLVLRPLGMDHTFFFAEDVLTHRFAVGHVHDPATDAHVVARPWALPRGSGPAGGMAASSVDQATWLRFHLGDGTADDGTRILPESTLRSMREPTMQTEGSTLGDAVGLVWQIKNVGATQVVGHAGTTIGQQAVLEMVADRGFGITVLTNSTNGLDLHKGVVRAALAAYLDLDWQDPQPVPRSATELEEYTGVYRNISMVSTLSLTDGGTLQIDSVPTQDLLDMVKAPAEAFLQPPIPIAMVEPEGDAFVAMDGDTPGHRGTFRRDSEGHLSGLHFLGRLSQRDPG